MYSVEFTKKAEGQFEKLDVITQKRIKNIIQRIKIRPHHFVKRIIGSDYFRLRCGQYRLIMDINNGKLLVLVLEIGHRRKVYKSL